MRQVFLILFLTTISISAIGQVDKQQPTIQVVGNAKLSIKPDLGVLVIRVTNKNMNFSQAITGLNDKTKDLTRQIVGIGFKQDDIKTTDFQIEENRIYRREEYIDSGYVARQSIKVDFKNQRDIITKILNTFSKSTTDFTLSFDFKLSDELKAKAQDELVRLAIKDSKDKAKLIAESAGIKLKRIKDISYGMNYFGGMREVEETAAFKVMASSAPSDAIVGFTPNDLLFADNVLITWEIE